METQKRTCFIKNIRASFLAVLVVLCVSSVYSQKSITLQPNKETGIDAFVFEKEPDKNFGTYQDFITFEWTFGGVPARGESYLKFDLSQLPKGSQIRNATLSLYHNPTSSNNGHEGSNAAQLKKVLSNWEENKITWANQPKTENSGIYLRQSTSETEDYVDIDLTEFVSFWHANPKKNYGMALDILTDQIYASMKFCSSDHSSKALRPRLIVEYTKNRVWVEHTVSVYPNPTSDYLIIKNNYPDKETNMFLFNSLGQLVWGMNLTQSLTFIGTSELSSGIYYYEITSGGLNKTGKIIKQK